MKKQWTPRFFLSLLQKEFSEQPREPSTHACGRCLVGIRQIEHGFSSSRVVDLFSKDLGKLPSLLSLPPAPMAQNFSINVKNEVFFIRGKDFFQLLYYSHIQAT